MPSWLMRTLMLLPIVFGIDASSAQVAHPSAEPDSAAQSPWAEGPDTFAMFQKFLLVVYPEFKEKGGYEFAVSVFGDFKRTDSEKNYTLRLIYPRISGEQERSGNDAGNQVPCKPDPSTENDSVMESSISFSDYDHRIVMFSNVSDYVNGRKLSRAQDEVHRHPGWTDEQVSKYLKSIGAQYGPWNKDELIKKIPVTQLEPFLGKLTLTSLQFVVQVPEGNVTGGPHTILLWQAFVTTHNPDGEEISFSLNFEPFEGKFVRLVEVQRPRK
jgi:hypothetical protein